MSNDLEYSKEWKEDMALWIKKQKMDYAKGILSRDKISKLESIKGWNWDIHNSPLSNQENNKGGNNE